MIESQQQSLHFLYAQESLPQYYGVDRLVILPRDPYWLYAYWELSLPTREKLICEWGEETWLKSSFQLRVCMHQWHREEMVENFHDLTLQEESDSWYISVPTADRLYHVELGRRLPGGAFIPLLCSNAVRTARDGLSDIIDEDWQLPDWKARKLYRRLSLYHLSSPEIFRRRKQHTQ